MLGRVKDEPEGGRGETLPPGLGYGTQVGNRRVDPGRAARQQPWQLGAILVGSALGSEGGELLWRQSGAARVGQESVQAAGEMEEVEANRRHTTRARPELVGGHVGDKGKNVLAYLQNGMGGGLEEWMDPVHGSAQPDFGRYGHVGNELRSLPLATSRA